MAEAARKSDHMSPEGKALVANIGKGKNLFRSLEEFFAVLDTLKKEFNLLNVPTMRPEQLPPLYAIAIRPVDIARDPLVKSDWYKEKSTGEFCLHHFSLLKAANAAELSWDPEASSAKELDRFCVQHRAVAWVRNFNGTWRQETDHGTCDLRDGSPEIHGMSEAELRRARTYVWELAESYAKNRVIRKALGVRSYTEDEVRHKPFVVAVLTFTGEDSDPEVSRQVKLMIAQNEIQGTNRLYGPPSEVKTLPGPSGRPIPPEVLEPRPAAAETPKGDCGCPDAPAGKHLTGCSQASTTQAASSAEEDDIPF